ncbi:hypothetical protein N7536_000043 [Penicillium majusculum]|nr:hypothetical protein N7536_000043 [Penicillium majusculum]
MEMHLVPCRPYRAHWIGQSGPLVPQLAALPNPTGKTNGPAPSLTSRSHRVPSQSSSVQKLHQARPSTSKSWTAEEDKKLMCLRNKGLTWTAISKELPGRTHLACRLRMQNYLSRPYEWTGNKQTWVAESYDRQKPELCLVVPEQAASLWQSDENMQWRQRNEQMTSQATTLSSLETSLETNIDGAPKPQTTQTAENHLPGILTGHGPPKKQNIKLPPIRTMVADLPDTQWFRKQPRDIAR